MDFTFYKSLVVSVNSIPCQDGRVRFVNTRLWIGSLILCAATSSALAAWWIFRLTGSKLDNASLPIIGAAVLYALIGGGAFPCPALIGSGTRQALQRRRYYRAIERSEIS